MKDNNRHGNAPHWSIAMQAAGQNGCNEVVVGMQFPILQPITFDNPILSFLINWRFLAEIDLHISMYYCIT